MSASRLMRAVRLWTGLALSLLLAAAAMPARCGEDWFTYYYLDRDTSQVVEVLNELAEEGALAPGPQEAPLASFFAEVFRAHPDQALGWVESADLRPEDRKPLVKALWLAGLEGEAVKLARRDHWPRTDLEKLRKPPPDRFAFHMSDPTHLDMMWAAFMATGDARYAVRVAEVLDYPVPEGEAGMAAQLLRSAARVSLAGNSLRHELVHRALQDEADRRTGLTREILVGVLLEVQTGAQSFPTRDGEFSALMFVTDDADFRRRWAELSVEEMPAVEPVSRVPRGREVEVELVFTGVGLDPELNAEVVWDLAILRPDGKAYGEFKGLQALKGRRPSRYMVSLAESSVRISFDPPDPAGVYVFRAVARDRVGDRKVELQAKLELAGDP
ncbi:MAG TPA: hypothetical protein VF104_04050 [Burkholderiales bacterium]